MEMYEFLSTIIVSEHSAEHSFTVSEHKKLSMLLVCILIDMVDVIPYIPTS